jgi:hypothetical protein
MKQPPSERDRAIADRRTEGRTLSAVAEEFKLTAGRVREICQRVENYDRGAALLSKDPASVEAMTLMRTIKPAVQHALTIRGVRRLTDLEGITMQQLLRWPNVGRQSAALLLESLAELKRD